MARLRGVLACLLALSLWGGVSFSAQAGFPPAGFAVWPEDTQPAAAAACAGRGEDEAWRTSPTETAERFAAEELGWTAPSAGHANDLGSQLRLIVYDDDAGGVFLGVVMDLFRYNDCWYIEYMFPREGGVPHTVGFTEVDGVTHFLLHALGDDRFFVDYGFGDESDVPMTNGEQLLFPVEAETDTGHFFLYDDDQPDVDVEGYTLPVPMEPSTAAPASPQGGYAMWPFNEVGRYSGVERCKRDWMHEPGSVVRKFIREEVGELSDLERQDRAHWIAEVDDARFRVVLRHVRQDCWPVRRVVDLVTPRNATIRPLQDGYTIDFQWGDAANSSIDLHFGGDWGGAFIERVPGPFSEAESFDFTQRGAYWIVLRDADGNILGVEGSQLGPINDR